MKSNKSTILLLIGAIIAGVAGYLLTDNYINEEVADYKADIDRGQQMVNVVVANKDLQIGDIIGKETVAVRPMPREYLHNDYISPSGYSSIEGAEVVHPLSVGDPVLSSYLSKSSILSFSDLLGKDQRAVTLPVDRLDTISGFLEPGHYIDLMITLQDGPRARTVPLLENVKIIATGGVLEGDLDQDQEFNQITLGVSAVDATRLIHAQTVGNISVLLRGSGTDDNLSTDEYITIDNLVGGKQEIIVIEQPQVAPRIGFEVIRGGKSS